MRTIVEVILLILFVGAGIYFLRQYLAYVKIGGTVLTGLFVKSRCRKGQCFTQSLTAFFAAFGILTLILWKSTATYMIVLCLILALFPAYKTYLVFTNEPDIHRAHITNMYCAPGRKRQHYSLKFSDESKLSVTQREYMKAYIGKTYYIVCFGGIALECFDADTYSLTE